MRRQISSTELAAKNLYDHLVVIFFRKERPPAFVADPSLWIALGVALYGADSAKVIALKKMAYTAASNR